MTERVAPDTFANTSNTSAFLVVVKNAWSNSIPIPKKTEKTNEIAKGLKLLKLFMCFLKYKNQSDVNTK